MVRNQEKHFWLLVFGKLLYRTIKEGSDQI